MNEVTHVEIDISIKCLVEEYQICYLSFITHYTGEGLMNMFGNLNGIVFIVSFFQMFVPTHFNYVIKVNITKNPGFNGDGIAVNCEIKDISYSSYEIIHNNDDVVSINERYFIKSMNETHEGLYTCIAKNKLGLRFRTSKDVYLNFFKEQAFPKAKEIVALRGEEVRMTLPRIQSGACSHLRTWVHQERTGTLTVTIASSKLDVHEPHTWETVALPGVSIEEDGTLVLNNVSMKDGGTYKLECEPLLGDYIRVNVAVLFVAGVVTCYGNKIENANCPKNQTMVVQTASYRGLPDSETCGLKDNHTCEVNVICFVKKHCDGQHECNITVNDSSIPVDVCPGLSKYLYFEYRCVDTPTLSKDVCAPSGAPWNIKITSRSTSTLTLAWDAPEKSKQNGVIVRYTMCVSHSVNGSCFIALITSEAKGIVANLQPATKYYVRVLASNKAGSSIYSSSEGFFTNGKPAKKASSVTSSALTFSLEIPSETFVYFYVVALKLTEDKDPMKTPDSYRNDDLVTYAEATASTIPKPYIAAVLTPSGDKGNYTLILGDQSNTSNPTTRRRRSASSDYHNGPLQPGTSYSIFQRIFINDQGDYYSTEWSPASKTEEYSGEDRKGSEQNLTGVVILAIVVIILLIIIGYLVYRLKTLSKKAKRESKAKRRSKAGDIYDLPEVQTSNADDVLNYEEVGDMAEQANYSSLNKSLREDDDHLYCHLNKAGI